MKKQPTPPTLVLYHANCQDGFMACYVAHLALGHTREDITYQAVRYNEPLPDLTNKEVFILDFSYKPELLIEAAKTAHSVVMLDHHKTAMQDWEGYTPALRDGEVNDEGQLETLLDKQNDNLEVSIRMRQSGAGMAWDYFDRELFTNERLGPRTIQVLRLLVRAVEDRDLWLFEHANTKLLCAALSVVPQTFEAYGDFVRNVRPDDMLKQGEGVLKHNENLAASIAKRAQLVIFEGHEVPLVNCNKEHTSIVGHALSADKPFAVLYEFQGTTASVSMRSRDEGQDVSAIACQYGGGGHRNAAAFTLSMTEFMALFFTLSVACD